MSRNAIIAIIVAVLVLGAAGGAFAFDAVSSNEPTAEETTPAQTATPSPSAMQPEPPEETLDDGQDEGQDEDPLADREAMEELGMEVAEIMTTWDPNEDFNRTAAEMRAADLMTEELADSITAPERPATGAEWLDAAAAGATSQPTVKPNRATSNEVVSIEATWVWVSENGDVVSNPTERRLFFFNFEQGDDGELAVSDYSYDTVD
ncbi:hypothetical protein I2485_07010 [Nesterenkonia sp. E16_7]|uniref:hypothetical protein n=1 Tax=unclassified Nesterenkonia TaxID=2629769 RepID=UPI001A9227C8|nr:MULTISPECIES: hypothetical protein [unclassified Nesterenkonia]MBO0596962.1 hypothetical protein [Nesterenkonia sp. E16_10]MBO0598400.1 hypothetical protein [Nesterenkonia sp. E16_7]